MAIGLGRLRLATRDFWALSPREFAALAGFLEKRGGAMARADLAKLMRRFPDEPPA
ncbi:phage tail assembly chaperone [Peteryoungia desertarenae]|nr:phage tail assembly chaperone [Peteryoungia desertarenae]